ncbi:MAG: response regulator [Burkholderiales bacterium]|nr:response regulator [Burkholderiales bacterium]
MSQGTILLVEDNDDDIDLTLRAFKRCNIVNRVVVATDGAQALDYLFKTGAYAGNDDPLPALMILDLNLPKIPGLDVLRRVRADARTRLMPAVVLTTSKEEQDVIDSYALGANAYTRKPVAFEEFLLATARLGMFWMMVNIPPPEGVAPSA